LGAEFEDNSGQEDDDETEPPCKRRAEAAKKSVADVVYCARALVKRGEDDIPEEPASNGAEECDAVCEGLGVRFYESGERTVGQFVCTCLETGDRVKVVYIRTAS
jgi:hypothetical protein